MQPDWKVLLIGGSSATGKSYLARQLAIHYQIPLTEVDDIRIALQQIADKEKHPDLFYFLDHPDYLRVNDTHQLVYRLIKVANEIWPALNELISKHIICNEPVIFEGDGIVPELLAQRDLHAIKCLFLVDTKEHLHARDLQRSRGNYTGEGADLQAEFSSQFGLELERQAIYHQLSVVKTLPLETLYERVLQELQ
jgi:2-phosphoglycerate kinase